jgi:hypothetical protein
MENSKNFNFVDNSENRDFTPPNERQQNKIIIGINYGDPDYAISHYSGEQLPKEERHKYIDNVISGAITRSNEEEFLKMITAPIDIIGVDKIFDRISFDRHQLSILAYGMGGDIPDRDKMMPDDIEHFISRFPTPIDFEDCKTEFLQRIGKKNGPEKLAEYRDAMRQFLSEIYGKRYEYYQQMILLRTEAESQADIQVGELESRNEKISNLNSMPAEEVEGFMTNVRIEGDPWKLNGAEHQLTTDWLESAKLEPKYKVNLNDEEIGLSQAYRIQGNHLAVVGYVKNEKRN